MHTYQLQDHYHGILASKRQWEHLVVFMEDALRYDYMPFDEIDGTWMDTIAQGSNTPTNFPVMLSGQLPHQHQVDWFADACAVPTILDLESTGQFLVSYMDHPHDPIRHVLHDPPRRSLDTLTTLSRDQDKPFVYVERDTATHVVYGRTWHERDDVEVILGKGREYSDLTGKEYAKAMREGTIPYKKHYRRGVEMAVHRFNDLITVLKDKQVLDDTLVVFTTDHGEVFPEDNAGFITHNHVHPLTINIATCFYGRELSFTRDTIRSIAIPYLYRGDLIPLLRECSW